MEPKAFNLKRSSMAKTPTGLTFTANKVVVKIADQWMDAQWDTIKKFTMEALLDEGIRLIIDCNLGEDKLFITTHEADKTSLRAKYPTCRLINLDQISGMLAELPKESNCWTVVPELLEMYNAKVVGHGENKN